MSRTAKRPRGGNSWKDSTHIGFDGIRVMMAASPDLIALGFSSVVLPVRENNINVYEKVLQVMTMEENFQSICYFRIVNLNSNLAYLYDDHTSP